MRSANPLPEGSGLAGGAARGQSGGMLDAFLRSLNPLALLESLLALWKDHVPDWIRKPIEAILWAGALLVLSWLTYINDQIATFGAIGYIVTGLLLTALLIWLAAGYRLLRPTAPYPLLRSAASNAELLSSEERDGRVRIKART